LKYSDLLWLSVECWEEGATSESFVGAELYAEIQVTQSENLWRRHRDHSLIDTSVE